jgi:hypothetical protein
LAVHFWPTCPLRFVVFWLVIPFEFRCFISPFRQFPRSRHHFGQCPIHVGSSSIQFYHVIPLYPYTLGIQRFFD